jgi:hypothetical protein
MRRFAARFNFSNTLIGNRPQSLTGHIVNVGRNVSLAINLIMNLNLIIMMKNFFLILSFLYFFDTIVSAQERIYMPYFEVINMHSDFQNSSTRLLKTYIETENKVEIILPFKDTSYYSETLEQALIKAKSLNAKHVIVGELNRVGEIVVISLCMYKTDSNEKEWSIIQKASSPDDLDPIMQKIAESINNRNSKNSSENIYDVTDYNSKQLNKMIATTCWGIEIGGGTAFANIKNKFPAGFSVIYSGDLRNLIFDLKGSMYISDISMYNLNLQINYPLRNKISSPYIGGGLGYGSTSMKNYVQNSANYYDGNGLTIFAGAGYIFNRTSNINLRFNSSLFFSMYQVNNIYPAGLLFGVMLLF